MKKQLLLWGSLLVLLGGTIFWTSCQKEYSSKQEIPEIQTRVISGVIPDDPAKVALVPLIVSSIFKSGNFEDRSEIEFMRGGIRDVFPPVVNITSPSAESTVSGVIAVTVKASDNVGVKSVCLSVDDSLVSISTISPFTNSWNSGTVANGIHILKVTASDRRGNKSTNSRRIFVNNITGGGDIIPPTINILNPFDQAFITGILTINVNAYDNLAVTSLNIYIDNSMVSTSTSYSWN